LYSFFDGIIVDFVLVIFHSDNQIQEILLGDALISTFRAFHVVYRSSFEYVIYEILILASNEASFDRIEEDLHEFLSVMLLPAFLVIPTETLCEIFRIDIWKWVQLHLSEENLKLQRNAIFSARIFCIESVF